MASKNKTKSTRSKRKSTKTSRSSKAKKKTRTATKKKAFGGYAINFAGRTETAEQIFGRKPIPPSEMTKKIWTFVKSKRLSNK